jgi:hypothetical protein
LIHNNVQSLLISIPFELSGLPKIKISDSLVMSYLEKTQKSILFAEKLTLPDNNTFDKEKKHILIMCSVA